jgi:hypothetical protein
MRLIVWYKVPSLFAPRARARRRAERRRHELALKLRGFAVHEPGPATAFGIFADRVGDGAEEVVAVLDRNGGRKAPDRLKLGIGQRERRHGLS